MNKEKKKNRITENIEGNKGLYLMPKYLYDRVLEDMDPDEIISLLGHVEQYNEYYDVLRYPYTTSIDKEAVFNKVLETNDVDFVYIVLCFYPEFQNIAFEFLKNCGNKKFIYEFIYAIDFDWNPEPRFSFLKNLEDLDDMILWNKVIRKNELNRENTMELLREEKWRTLKVMWVINNKVKFKPLQKDEINRYLSTQEVADKIKKIDRDFYDRYVKHIKINTPNEAIDAILEDYENKVFAVDNQISFNDYNIKPETLLKN